MRQRAVPLPYSYALQTPFGLGDPAEGKEVRKKGAVQSISGMLFHAGGLLMMHVKAVCPPCSTAGGRQDLRFSATPTLKALRGQALRETCLC